MNGYRDIVAHCNQTPYLFIQGLPVKNYVYIQHQKQQKLIFLVLQFNLPAISLKSSHTG